MTLTLEKIAAHLGLECVGDPGKEIRGVAPVGRAGADRIAFASGTGWRKKLDGCKAGAVIVPEAPGIEGMSYIVSPHPHHDFIRVVRLFHPEKETSPGVSPLAAVAEGAKIAETASVAEFVSIGAGAKVGARSRIAPCCAIGEGVTIGEDCDIHSNVTLEHGVVIGDRVIIHAGTVIGADGYGYLQHEGRHVKIPQVGSVRIGNDVEIGANVCIDRGTLDDTVIGDGVKIDNLVQVGHNVMVGEGALIVSQVGISGSCEIGRGVVLAGRAGLKDHVRLGDGAVAAAAAVVTHDVKAGEVVCGYPAIDIETWRRSQVIVRNLPRLWPEILALLRREREQQDE